MSEGSELLQEGNLLTPSLLLHKKGSVGFIKLFIKSMKWTTIPFRWKQNKTAVSARWLSWVKMSAAMPDGLSSAPREGRLISPVVLWALGVLWCLTAQPDPHYCERGFWQQKAECLGWLVNLFCLVLVKIEKNLCLGILPTQLYHSWGSSWIEQLVCIKLIT